MNYNETDDFLTLQKLSDLEKRIENDTIDGKFKNMIKKDISPMAKVMKIRFSTRIPIEDMNESIRSGTDEFSSHLHARNIVLKPQEALYHAIGKEDKALYDLLSGITITDIMSMIKNKAAVSQFKCGRNMDISSNDIPRHIGRMMVLRSVLPSVLAKEAEYHIDKGKPDIRELFVLTTDKGESINVGSKSLNRNIEEIEKYVNDGTIIKVIKMYHNGNKSRNLIKKADMNLEDGMYLSLLYGF